MKALAAILVELEKPLALEEIQIPKLKFGQVLVQLICSGICGSQLGEIDGAKGSDKYLPHLLGHEGTGIVVDCGEGVNTIKEMDKVVLHWKLGAGIQSTPPIYESGSLGKVNAGWVTTFNEYAVVSENRLTVIPEDFDPEIGALMGCAVTTGLGVINNNAKLKIGESVVIWGAGGVGLNMVQGAAMVSAYPIIAIDLFDHKLDIAQKMGATHTINARNIDPKEEILKIVGKNGADVVIDNTGNVEIIHNAYEVTGSSGRTILVGVPPKGKETVLYTLPLHFKKILTGSHGGEAQPDIDIPRYIRLMKSQKMSLEGLITHKFELEKINDALDVFRNGEAGRIIISFRKQ
jgi:S-(hydroxymethyl)glutathione dehydrogenase / alcohol dehydrogenase